MTDDGAICVCYSSGTPGRTAPVVVKRCPVHGWRDDETFHYLIQGLPTKEGETP